MRAKRIAFWLAVMWVAACNADETVAPVKQVGFTVTGVVRDQDGVPLADALAKLSDKGYGFTNAAGVFRIEGVQGAFNLLVSKESYTDFYRELVVTGDVFVEAVLTAIPYPDSLVLGKTVQSSVSANAPPCDPIHWDARAPCRKFTFRAPQSGVLAVTIAWEGGSQLDVVITTVKGKYLAASAEDELGRASASALVARGELYEVWVNSYYEGNAFALRADFVPNASVAQPLGRVNSR